MTGAGHAGLAAVGTSTVGLTAAYRRMRVQGPTAVAVRGRDRSDVQTRDLIVPESRRWEPIVGNVRSSLRMIIIHGVNTASNVVGDDVVSRWIRRMLLRLAGATVPSSSSLHGGTYFSHPGNLHMGNRCFINGNCYLDLKAPVTICDDVVVGHGTTIVTSMHAIGPATRRAGRATGRPVVLESGVWLGACTLILPGVTVGAGSIVAAGAVVTADVPVDVIVAGVPAKVVRKLDGEPDDRPRAPR